MKVFKPVSLPWVLGALIIAQLWSMSSAAKPYPLLWNTTHFFGYDGPWHAIPMKIGSPEQVINLYPGGAWGSVMLASDMKGHTGGRYESQKWLEASNVWNASLSNPSEADSTQNHYIQPLPNDKASRTFDGG
ncbi:hypothetical protein BBP40_010039 [Aspergillus hancockii]|nr:hypothetical protein BBP40_010039 [Aspergillus hancockii]